MGERARRRSERIPQKRGEGRGEKRKARKRRKGKGQRERGKGGKENGREEKKRGKERREKEKRGGKERRVFFNGGPRAVARAVCAAVPLAAAAPQVWGMEVLRLRQGSMIPHLCAAPKTRAVLNLGSFFDPS